MYEDLVYFDDVNINEERPYTQTFGEVRAETGIKENFLKSFERGFEQECMTRHSVYEVDQC